MAPIEAVIEPHEMATIYWRWMRSGAIYEVEFILNRVSPVGKEYWNEVLTLLNIKKNGKKILQ